MLCRARTPSGARFAAGCWVQSPRRRAPRCLALFVYDDAPIVVKFIIASLTRVLEHVSIWASP
jgi:hypothetical protein